MREACVAPPTLQIIPSESQIHRDYEQSAKTEAPSDKEWGAECAIIELKVAQSSVEKGFNG